MTRISTNEDDLDMNQPRRGFTESGGAGTLEHFRIVVIGGGPAGLGASCELAQRAIDFVILEKGGRLGENWRPQWDPVRLFTAVRFDGLPGVPLHDDAGSYLTKDQMSDYLERYAELFGLPVRLGIHVLGLTPNERGEIVIEWEHGRLLADQVIVATDLHVARQRTAHDQDRREIRLCAGEYRTLSQLAEAGDVFVLGAGSTRLTAGLSPRGVASRPARLQSR